MSIKLHLLFFFFGSLICFSQTDSTKVPFVAYWSIDDNYDYAITKIKKKWSKGELKKTDSTTYFANFSVIDSTETEYLISWKLKSNFLNLPAEFSNLLNDKSIVLELKYKTNELGEFLGIENWQEVSTVIEAMFATAFVNMKSKLDETDITKLKEAIQPFIDVYTSKEGVESLLLEELLFFHYPMGVELDFTEPYIYEDEYDNFFGGNPLRGTSKITFEEVDFEEGFCVFKVESAIYPEDSKQMLKEMIKQMSNTTDMNKLNEIIDEGKYEIYDNHLFAYYFYPGLPLYIETNRTSDVEIEGVEGKVEEMVRVEMIFD